MKTMTWDGLAHLFANILNERRDIQDGSLSDAGLDLDSLYGRRMETEGKEDDRQADNRDIPQSDETKTYQGAVKDSCDTCVQAYTGSCIMEDDKICKKYRRASWRSYIGR